MDALILSCGTGGGHNSAAKAIQEELERQGHHAHMMNPYLLKSMTLTRIIDNLYIFIAKKMPRFFGFIYGIAQGYRRLPGHSPVYHINKNAAFCLNQYLQENHFDIIVTTHLYPAEMITLLKRSGICLPRAVFVATDYACIPFTEETDCDAYIIPMESLKKEFLHYGIEEEKLYPIGIPVAREFTISKSREEAAAELGLATDRHYILVAGGSMGAGHIRKIVEALLAKYKEQPEVSVIVICGSSKSLYKKLCKLNNEQLLPVPFTDKMADYLRVCDVYLSKPGGLSSSEAATTGVPMIHISPIPGCETKNQRCFKKRGMSIPTGKSRERLFRALDELSSDEAKEIMVKRQHKWVNAHAAEDICRFLEGFCTQGK